MQKTAKIKTQHKISDMPTMKNCPMKISFALSSILFIPFAAEAFAPSFASDRSASSVSSAIRPGQSSTNLNSLPTSLDTLTSGLASISRIQYGVTVAPNRVSLTGPAAFYLPKLKILYDVENSRACRSVRERITELDLAVDKVIPSAKNSRVMNGGLEGVEKPSIVPTLVAIVEGKEQKFQGEDQILGFLNEKFSNEKKISKIKPLAPLTDLESIEETESSAEVENAVTQIKEILSDLTKYLPGLLRPSRGTKVASPASFTLPNVPRPRKPLILYSYEGNQFCRLVREILTELDLPYELRSAGKGSFRREELSEITGGSSQCPYLIDPNTEIRMPESKDIIQYLYDTYALWTPPSELLRLASAVVTPLLAPLYKLITPLQAGSYRENEFEYRSEIAEAKAEIFDEISTAPVVIYTYELSPFCTEATNLLDNIGVRYKKVSLGREWIPGLIDNPAKRAALLEITGQSSLPNVFIGGTSIGGLYSGKPGIIPALEKGIFMDLVEDAKRSM